MDTQLSLFKKRKPVKRPFQLGDYVAMQDYLNTKRFPHFGVLIGIKNLIVNYRYGKAINIPVGVYLSHAGSVQQSPLCNLRRIGDVRLFHLQNKKSNMFEKFYL